PFHGGRLDAPPSFIVPIRYAHRRIMGCPFSTFLSFPKHSLATVNCHTQWGDPKNLVRQTDKNGTPIIARKSLNQTVGPESTVRASVAGQLAIRPRRLRIPASDGG